MNDRWARYLQEFGRTLTSFPSWPKILGSSVESQILRRMVVLPAFARPMMSMRKGPNLDRIFTWGPPPEVEGWDGSDIIWTVIMSKNEVSGLQVVVENLPDQPRWRCWVYIEEHVVKACCRSLSECRVWSSFPEFLGASVTQRRPLSSSITTIARAISERSPCTACSACGLDTFARLHILWLFELCGRILEFLSFSLLDLVNTGGLDSCCLYLSYFVEKSNHIICADSNVDCQYQSQRVSAWK